MEGFPNYPAILIQIVGFGVLYWLLKAFFFVPIGRVLGDRERVVRERLDDAESNRRKMVAAREDYERRLAEIESEARNRVQEAVQEAHKAREELLAQARQDHDKLLERAQKEIDYAWEKARDDVKNRVAEVAVLVAGRIVEKNLDADAHRALIDDVLNQVKSTDRV